MAVHDLGYRAWSGERAPKWTPAAVIAKAGVRRAWQSRWLHRLVRVAWLPAFWFAIGFFLWEQSLLYPELREGIQIFVRGAPEELQSALRMTSDDAARHTMWAWLLQTFFRYPQGILMVLVVGQIAPRLISQDIRSRAFLLYFSRPLGRWEYILGKLATLLFFLTIISTAPALTLYLLGVFLSPQLDVLAATWDLPLRIVGATAILALPTTTLALWLSAMTQESRYAGFAWFAVWILGWVAYGILTTSAALDPESTGDPMQRWANVSLYHALGRLQSWMFGFLEFSDVRSSALLCSVITLVCLGMLYRRVGAPMRV